MTSETLQKIFKESEIHRAYFFPKKVPSLNTNENSTEKESNKKTTTHFNKE